MTEIHYRAGYKYQLTEEYACSWRIRFVVAAIPIQTRWLYLNSVIGCHRLVVAEGYAWDGPSGPAFDTSDFMRASLVHDALYQLIRLGFVPRSAREAADDLMREICIADGMHPWRAWWCHRAVRLGGGPATDPAREHLVLVAPR